MTSQSCGPANKIPAAGQAMKHMSIKALPKVVAAAR
jgi:hypothetical protein